MPTSYCRQRRAKSAISSGRNPAHIYCRYRRRTPRRSRRTRTELSGILPTAAGLVRPVLDVLRPQNTPAVQNGHRRGESPGVDGATGRAHQRTQRQGCKGVVPRRPAARYFICPGQGSQWLGMGRDLLQSAIGFPKPDGRGRRRVPALPAKVVGTRHSLRAATKPLSAGIDFVQPALFAIQVSLAALWTWWGVPAKGRSRRTAWGRWRRLASQAF